MSRARRVALPAVGLAVVLALSACATGAQSPHDGAYGPIIVFAAASLREPFTEIAQRFEADHPGADVTLNFAGSADLITQITEGAPADVLATADQWTMQQVQDAGLLAGDPEDFTTNTLQLAVPPDNPAGVSSLADAAREGVKTVVCAEQVPCGATARALEESAGVDLTPVSEETSVTDVLGKVTSGEADAGLVYVTDVLAAGDAVLGIEVPEASSAATTYPIAAVSNSEETETAQAFVDFVAGKDGRTVLGAAGFGAP